MEDFDKYEIIRRMAVGGMGEIFLGRQKGMAGFERQVVIKTMLPDLATQEDLLQQFLDEARVAATFNHPNVVAVHDVGCANGTYYIAMEYIRGVDLGQLMAHCTSKQLKVPFHAAAAIIREVALGLDHAHSAMDVNGRHLGVVHRDVSPQNIMVRDDGVVKVVDFGVARAANRATRTQGNVIKGKISYMSPEHLRGGEIDHRSDLFSLGVVLWEMLAGERLFVGDNPMAIIKEVLFGEPRPVLQARPDTPPTLVAVLSKLLAPLEDRYERGADVASDLQVFLEANGGTAAAELQVLQLVLPVLSSTQEAASGGTTQASKLPSPAMGMGTPKPPTPVPRVTSASNLPSIPGMRSINAGALPSWGDASDSGTAFSATADDAVLELATVGHTDQQTMVGRGRELRALREMLEQCTTGTQLAVVCADNGMGKTRLIEELDKLLGGSNFLVVRACGGRAGVPVTYDVAEQVLLGLAKAIRQDGSLSHTSAASTGLDQLDAMQAVGCDLTTLRCAKELLGAPLSREPWDPTRKRNSLEGSFFRMLQYAASHRPVCVLVDDLHLADAASQTLLQTWPARLKGLPAALVCTARPEPEVTGWADTLQLILKPLTEDEIVPVAMTQTHGGTLPGSAAQLVVQRAGGNPLAAGLIVQLLGARGHMALTNGRWQMQVDPDPASIPSRPDQLVAAVFKQLPEASRNALARTAVLGLHVHLPQLDAWAGKEIREGIRHLCDTGWLAHVDGGNDTVRFRSSSAREVLLGHGAPAQLQRTWRAELAREMERSTPASDRKAQEILARLFLISDDPERAAQATVRSAQRLADQGALAPAADLFRRVLSRLRRLLEGQEDERAVATVLATAARACECLRPQLPAEALSTAEGFLGAAPVELAIVQRAELTRQKALALRGLGRTDGANAAMEEALTLLRVTDVEAQVRMTRDQAQWLFEQADVLAGTNLLAQAVRAAARPTRNEDMLWDTLCQLADAYLQAGQAQLAQQASAQAAAQAQKADNPTGQLRALTVGIRAALHSGNTAEASRDAALAEALLPQCVCLTSMAEFAVWRARLVQQNQGEAAEAVAWAKSLVQAVGLVGRTSTAAGSSSRRQVQAHALG